MSPVGTSNQTVSGALGFFQPAMVHLRTPDFEFPKAYSISIGPWMRESNAPIYLNCRLGEPLVAGPLTPVGRPNDIGITLIYYRCTPVHDAHRRSQQTEQRPQGDRHQSHTLPGVADTTFIALELFRAALSSWHCHCFCPERLKHH